MAPQAHQGLTRGHPHLHTASCLEPKSYGHQLLNNLAALRGNMTK